MAKFYYRCSACHSKVDMSISYCYAERGARRCRNCNTIIRLYQCQKDDWWELWFLKLKDIWEQIRK